jgi:hypothetical protein
MRNPNGRLASADVDVGANRRSRMTWIALAGLVHGAISSTLSKLAAAAWVGPQWTPRPGPEASHRGPAACPVPWHPRYLRHGEPLRLSSPMARRRPARLELVLHGLAADLRSKPSHTRRRVWWILPCRTDSHGFEVCQQKRMVPSTVGMGVETAVESQLSEVGNERDL